MKAWMKQSSTSKADCFKFIEFILNSTYPIFDFFILHNLPVNRSVGSICGEGGMQIKI